MQHLKIATFSFLILGFLTLAEAKAQGGKKLPVPSKEAQEKSGKLIFELFKEEIDKLKAQTLALEEFQRIPALHKEEIDKLKTEIPRAQASLAQTYLKVARDTDDDPTGRYVLLRFAMASASHAGDAPTALEAAAVINQFYAVPAADGIKTKIGVLMVASKSFPDVKSFVNLIDSASQLVEEALAEDDYQSAHELLQAVENAGRKLRNVPLVSATRNRQEEIKKLEKKFARWKPFADKLAKMPDDPEANLRMGVYQALVKGNWDRGLPLLEKGTNARLKKLAAMDRADPSAARKQVQAAELWFELAQNNPVPKILDEKEFESDARTQLLLRSYHWYQDALGFLSAKERDQVEQRMLKIAAMLPAEYSIGEITREYGAFFARGSGPVYCAAFSPDGRKVISASADGMLRLWNLRTGKEERQIDSQSGRVWTVCFTPDGRHVVSGGFDGSVRVWDLATGRESRHFSGHSDYVRSVKASRDGRFILSGGDDRLLRLWSEESGQEVRSFPGHNHFVWSVDLSRNGKLALSASLDKTVRLWDVNSGKQLQELRGHKDTVLSAVFSPDGRRALSGSTDKTLILWDLEEGKELFPFKGHTGYVHSVAMSPDGRRALSGSQDKTIRLWDVYTGKELRLLNAHQDQVWHVAFSPDGRLALSCGQDGTLRIWSGSTYRPQ